MCGGGAGMLGMSGNYSEQIFRSICSGECQVEAAGLIFHQPPSIIRAVIREGKPPPSDSVLHSVGHSKLHQTVPMQNPSKTPDSTSLLAGGKVEDT